MEDLILFSVFIPPSEEPGLESWQIQRFFSPLAPPDWLTVYFSKIDLNVIFPCPTRYSKWLFSRRLGSNYKSSICIPIFLILAAFLAH
jgi:hypothetical protein